MKYLLPLILACYMACTGNAPSDKQTDIFSNYLGAGFGLSIPAHIHHYILIPKMTCKGCVNGKLQDELPFLQEEVRAGRLTLITSNLQVLDEPLKQKLGFLTDTQGSLDRLNLRIRNMAVVRTKDHRVSSITSVQTDDTTRLSLLIK